MRIYDWTVRGLKRFSFLGLLLGGVFFAMSLTPSLIPRNFLFQGVLAGVCFTAGYGLGALFKWGWEFLEIPQAPSKLWGTVNGVTALLVVGLMLVSLWKSAGWQNSIRELMGMELLETGNPTKVALVAFILALVLIVLGRWIGALGRFSYRKLQYVVPPRVAAIVGPLIVAVLLINVVNGVLVKGALRFLDSTYAALDNVFDDGIEAPTAEKFTGSPQSLISWDDLGRRGREFVVTGPTRDQIAAFTGEPAKQPIRVYVGLNSGDSFEERGALALAELIRVDAFSREVLVVVTPTGTGWVDPMAADPVDYIHGGDIASVAVQYSYLSSPVSLLVQPEQSRESAQAVFELIYAHWHKLDKATRPRLYLNGLSLGSHGSEASLQLYKMLGDPINGAFWAGPPFANTIHNEITDAREKGSTAWLPVFQNGLLFRFNNQHNASGTTDAGWGPLRIVYLQYPSDAIVFFDLKGAFQRSDWMTGVRGADVSEKFTWYPVVTFVQLMLDMGIATSVPFGFGHNYDAPDYIDGWVEVTAPEGWDNDDSNRLKTLFSTAVENN